MKRLDGKTAIVTGAASGIGLGIATAFVREGARVLLADIDTAGGEAAAGTLGSPARFVQHDAASPDSWARVRDVARSDFGGLDIMVNNAGVALNGTIEDLPLEGWHRAVAVNCTGPLLGCRTAIELMRDSKRPGSIINIASAAGVKVTSYAFAYGATKSALIFMSRGIALHCCERKYPIRCNVINPGVVDSNIHKQVYEQLGGKEAAWEMYVRITPMGIVGDPADVAHAAVYLASDESRYVTGAALEVDGALAIS